MSEQVKSVFIKHERGQRVQEPSNKTLVLKAKQGVEGDANSNSTSPRQVLIASQESLDHFHLQGGDLKENILTEGFPTDELKSGTVIQIGQAIIRITFPCEPCKYITSLGIRNLSEINGRRGVLGVVLRGGEVTVGNSLSIVDDEYPAIPTRFSDRLSWVTERIPAGKVVTYKQMVKLAGGASSYIRAIPGFIRRHPDGAVHRIVDSDGGLIGYAANQEALLIGEGIPVMENKVDLIKYSWDASDLFYSK
ncbi:MAG: MGMT family protein [bacterium]|nr:MGMT family protein [bacterium]